MRNRNKIRKTVKTVQKRNSISVNPRLKSWVNDNAITNINGFNGFSNHFTQRVISTMLQAMLTSFPKPNNLITAALTKLFM